MVLGKGGSEWLNRELIKRLLTAIRAARRSGIKTEDLLHLGEYDEIQDALVWLHDKGLIQGEFLDELGENYGDIWFSTITTAGRDFMANDYEFSPVAVEVTFDERQLEAVLLGLAKKFGKPGETSALRRFFKQAGNAGVNALATETVKQMITHLPEIARRLM